MKHNNNNCSNKREEGNKKKVFLFYQLYQLLTYQLHPLDQNFDPKLHNKYFRNREKHAQANHEIMFECADNLIKSRNRHRLQNQSLHQTILL